ncbi:2-isopropylmalate synthase [Mycena latifolia]|nr:2-isopropylmalate synthase [Mycena latifolia]
MPMIVEPAEKYKPYVSINLVGRQWPNRIISSPPTWVSTDLRDGNQALATPMSIEQKLTLFQHLVACGFKEIEVGFPSASTTEFSFLRALIESGLIPEDVWIQVMTPARKDLITRTFEAIQGATRVLIQLYSSTSDLFREVIYRYSREELIQLAIDHTHFVRQLADDFAVSRGSSFRLVYGVEGFSQSDPEFVVQICSSVKNAWDSHGKTSSKIIFNLASTVEVCGPNHFADQIEFFCNHMPNRDDIIVGVHTHNDRGTAVAATELALLAGAQRVDGCLFGNGERTGNVDLVTLALNMYSQGISPGLDFSHLGESIDLITQFTNLPVHPRHPYAGELVYTAFSGAHQDGIAKGFEAMASRHKDAELHDEPMLWSIPYLPVDPTDFGFTYTPIRVNSQSGKGGVAFVIKQTLNIDIPRAMQITFHSFIQKICDTRGCELTPEEIASQFREFYHFRDPGTDASERIFIQSFDNGNMEAEGTPGSCGTVVTDGVSHTINAGPGDPLQAWLDVIACNLGHSFIVAKQESETMASGICTYIMLKNGHSTWWGVGLGKSSMESKLRAVVSAVNSAIM